MAKELYLYSSTYNWTAEALNSRIEENMGEDITLREDSPGGSVYAANCIFAKVKEHGRVHLKVDGAAMSMGSFLPLYCKSSETLDVARFVFHRADMFVDSPETQAFLDGINKDLKSKMLAKVDSAIFKTVTGYSIEELFDPEKRIDIPLTGKQAVDIGLVDKLTKLTPEIQSEITAFQNKFYQVAAIAEPTITKTITMTKAELLAAHPGVYAEIFNEGKVTGSKEMKEIAEAWAHFAAFDPKASSEGIKSGIAMTQLQMIELTQKQFSAKALTDVELDSEKKPLATGEAKTKEETEAAEKEAWLKEVKAETQTFKTVK